MRLATSAVALALTIALATLSGCASLDAPAGKTFQAGAPVGALGPMPEANSPRNQDQSPHARDAFERPRVEQRDRVRVNEVCVRCR